MERINGQHLHFIGWTEDVDKYYQKAVLHIMPSLYEGFGLVVLEAAVNGTPTIAYDGSGMQDIITDQCDGILTKQRDWMAMAKEILCLLDSPERLIAMQNNLPDLLEKYSPHNIRKKWIELFDILLCGDKKTQEAYFQARQVAPASETAKRVLEEIELLGVSTVRGKKETPSREIPNDNGESYWKENYMTVLNSTSWKLTKPLRFLADILKNLIHH